MANRIVRVVAAVIEREGKYLITQRREEAVLPGLWEFPGGKVDPGESDEQALHREVLGRIGVDVDVAHKLAERHHAYEKYDVHLTLYSCRIGGGREPNALRLTDVRWTASCEVGKYASPPAAQATLRQP